MNTISVVGAYASVRKYLKDGGVIFENKTNDLVIKKYIGYLSKLGVKENTIVRKSGMPYMFLKYLYINKVELKSITKESIYDYLVQISKLNWNITYLEVNKLNLKKFLNWLFENKIIKVSGDFVLPRINWHQRTNIKSYYTREEISKMLNVIDTNSDKGKEDFLILSIICYLGLRISDVIDLKLSNIDFEKNKISIIQYKTKENLTLPLIDEIKYPLLDYLKNVRPQGTNIDYVFITKEKPFIKKEWLKHQNKKVGKYLTKANIDIKGRKHGFHSLRFSFSTMLLKNNVDIYSISTILGHKDIGTTMSYLDTDILKLKELALEVPDVK